MALEHLSHFKGFKPLVIFGSVPMFFYILHLYVLKLLYVMGIELFGPNQGDYFSVDSVSALWLITVFLIILLYPVVAWFSRYKHQNKHIAWLKYF